MEIKVKRTYAPVSFNGKLYQRSGSNTIELNGGNLTNFLLKKYGKTWDDVVVENFTIEDIDLETIVKFKIWTSKRAEGGEFTILYFYHFSLPHTLPYLQN